MKYIFIDMLGYMGEGNLSILKDLLNDSIIVL